MAYVGLATIKASGDIDYEELEAYDEQLTTWKFQTLRM